MSTVLINIVDTALLSSPPPTPRDRREGLEQLRQLGLREGILNRNSPTQAKRDVDSPAASAANTKGVDAVDIDACDLGQGDGGCSGAACWRSIEGRVTSRLSAASGR